MFCQNCGTSMAAAASACPSCHSSVALASAGMARTAVVTENVRAAVGSALGALKSLAGDPVGRLPATYEALGEDKARRVGLSFGVASVILFLLGGYLLLPVQDGLLDFLGFGGTLKCLLFGVLPFGGTVLGSLAARKLLGGNGSLGGDLFLSGAALLPVSLAMPINGLLGYENYGLMAALSIFAACTSVLVLYSGYRRISKFTERTTTLVIPTVLVLVAWLGKTMAASVLESGMGGY